jgi:hypothetical protein
VWYLYGKTTSMDEFSLVAVLGDFSYPVLVSNVADPGYFGTDLDPRIRVSV